MSENLNHNLVFNPGPLFYQMVSYQPDTYTPFTKEITINHVLSEIKHGVYEQQITKLRKLYFAGNKEGYENQKKALPAVTFCGTFENKRRKDFLKSYNFVIILDIDKLEPNELSRVKDCLFYDSHVISYWESPSQNGIKGLVPIQYECEINKSNVEVAHKNAFHQIAQYYNDKYNIILDQSGSDTTRLCFFSHDSNIKIKRFVNRFKIIGSEFRSTSFLRKSKSKADLRVFIGTKDALYNSVARNNPRNRYSIYAIIKYLTKRKLSITRSYEEWYKVAMAIANSFTFDIGLKYFLKLSSIDDDKYDKQKCINFLTKCYQNRSGAFRFNTIVYLANKKGYLTRIQRGGVPSALDENPSQISSS